MTRQADGPRKRLPGPSEDITAAKRNVLSIVPHGRFGEPSNYSLTRIELARHVRQLRRTGWQSWEIRARFDFWGAA